REGVVGSTDALPTVYCLLLADFLGGFRRFFCFLGFYGLGRFGGGSGFLASFTSGSSFLAFLAAVVGGKAWLQFLVVQERFHRAGAEFATAAVLRAVGFGVDVVVGSFPIQVTNALEYFF